MVNDVRDPLDVLIVQGQVLIERLRRMPFAASLRWESRRSASWWQW
jgi:hypothetical protein